MDTESFKQECVTISLRLRLPFLSFILLLIAALFLPDRVWNTLLIGFGGMFFVAYIWVWQLSKGLHGKRKLHAQWVAVGDLLKETFTLWNKSPIPALWVEVIDHSNIPGYQTAVVRSPGTNQQDSWHETAVCLQRGQYNLGPWTIRTGDPFGIFTSTRHYPQANEIIIHPPIHTELPFALPTGQSSGRKRARQHSLQATTNAAAIRAYTHGDPLRWIHWPSTARRNEIFVRQFDLDATGDIWLLLDMDESVQCGQGLESTEEYGVLLAAALTAQSIQQNRTVGLAGYGRIPQIIPTGAGIGQQWRILRALALIKADGTTSLLPALNDLGQVANRGSAVIIITANPDIDWIPELLHLAQRGIESNVILLDRPSFDAGGNSRLQSESIQNLGINCHIIHRGDLDTQIPETKRDKRFKITPMGRAVIVAD